MTETVRVTVGQWAAKVEASAEALGSLLTTRPGPRTADPQVQEAIATLLGHVRALRAALEA